MNFGYLMMSRTLLGAVIILMIEGYYGAFEEFCTIGEDNCERPKNIGIKSNERRILLIGKTGVGKSTTGNTILGEKVFDAAVSGKSITSTTKLGQAERFGKRLLVVDTPGLYDTNKDNEQIITEITKCYGITSPGIHAIVMVVEIGRFTEEENKTVEFFLERFGKNVANFLVIAFTHKVKLDLDDMTINEYVHTLGEETSLKKLLNRINNRYVVFGYKGDINEREREVQNLLDVIDRMIEYNGGTFYTNEMYEETERLLSQRWEEEKRNEKERHDKEIQEALQDLKIEHAKEQSELSSSILQLQKDHQKYLERREVEWQEMQRQREENYRREIRKQMESGKGGFFSQLLHGIGRFLRGFFRF